MTTEPYKLMLSGKWDGCPPAWQNFIRSLQNGDYDRGVYQLVIQRALDEYNAYYRSSQYYPTYVMFDSAEDATAFELKFG